MVKGLVTDQMSVVVRFHDPQRLNQLDEALFSLSFQNYTPIQVVVVVQNGNPSLIQAIEELISKQPFQVSTEPLHKVLSVEVPPSQDGRSILLNQGIHAANGQYLGFLDYDDTVYPVSYSLLISRIKNSGFPIAVGGCRIAFQRLVTDLKGNSYYFTKSKRPYLSPGEVLNKSKLDLFLNNFIPIHSYVLDRKQIDPTMIKFNPELSCFEDYEFLLKCAAQYEFDFAELATPVVEYRIRNDGSNTIPTEHNNPLVKQKWENAQKIIDQLKSHLLVRVTAQELSQLLKERHQLREMGIFHNIQKSGFFKLGRRLYQTLRKFRIFIFRSFRYND